MASEGKIELVVLWEEELRQAAALFDAYDELPLDSPDEEKQRAACAAFDAAASALNGLKPGVSMVMISNRSVSSAKQNEEEAND